MLPNEIRAALLLANKTISAIAREMNISQPAVTDVVYQKRKNPRIRAAIAEAIGKPVSEIWPDPKPEEQAA